MLRTESDLGPMTTVESALDDRNFATRNPRITRSLLG